MAPRLAGPARRAERVYHCRQRVRRRREDEGQDDHRRPRADRDDRAPAPIRSSRKCSRAMRRRRRDGSRPTIRPTSGSRACRATLRLEHIRWWSRQRANMANAQRSPGARGDGVGREAASMRLDRGLTGKVSRARTSSDTGHRPGDATGRRTGPNGTAGGLFDRREVLRLSGKRRGAALDLSIGARNDGPNRQRRGAGKHDHLPTHRLPPRDIFRGKRNPAAQGDVRHAVAARRKSPTGREALATRQTC